MIEVFDQCWIGCANLLCSGFLRIFRNIGRIFYEFLRIIGRDGTRWLFQYLAMWGLLCRPAFWKLSMSSDFLMFGISLRNHFLTFFESIWIRICKDEADSRVDLIMSLDLFQMSHQSALWSLLVSLRTLRHK